MNLPSPLPTLRTLLFVPGDRPERFDKAQACGADAIALDLEDAVLPESKASARSAIAAWKGERSARVIVRINAETTPWFEDDLRQVRDAGYREIMLPKAADPDAIGRIRAVIGKDAGIYPLVETAQGSTCMRELARAPGVRRLIFGTVDFSRDTGIQNEEGWLPVRVEMVIASRIAGCASPIDGTLLGWSDPEHLRAQAARSRSLGFGGRLCIHPAQVAPIRAGMQPSSEERAWAQRVLDAVAHAQHGAIVVDGKLVDKPVVDLARDWIAQGQD